MLEIRYITGDATDPSRDSPGIIVHVCNDIGAWGKGFVVAISRRWKQPEQCYRAWSRGEGDIPFALGQVQFVEVEDKLWVANLIGQHGIRQTGGKPPIRYEAIRQGLSVVAGEALRSSAQVHMPRIGCGLAGGVWEEIEPIIQEELVSKGVSVTVYDLP